MTSCLLVKGPDRLVAVADGRLTVGDAQIRTNEAEKLRLFTPWYRLPIASMGRFDHFVEIPERNWGVAYAGTYSLATLVIDKFIKAISGGLYLDRGANTGSPCFVDSYLKAAQYLDSYNFTQTERLRLGAYEISSEFEKAVEIRFREWARLTGAPDCEFLLFGEDHENGEYHAYRFQLDTLRWHATKEVAVDKKSVRDGEIIAIGSAAIKDVISKDFNLQKGVTGWVENQTQKAISETMSGKDLDSWETEASSLQSDPLNWSSGQVIDHFAKTIIQHGDQSVGGQLLAIEGCWGSEMELREI